MAHCCAEKLPKPAIFGSSMCTDITDITVRKIAAILNCSAQQYATGVLRAYVAYTTWAPRAPVVHCTHIGCVRAVPSVLLLHTLWCTWAILVTRVCKNGGQTKNLTGPVLVHYSVHLQCTHTVYCRSTKQCAHANKVVCGGIVRLHAYTAMRIHLCAQVLYSCARTLLAQIIYEQGTLPCAGV